jgi:hypothetical protein
MKLLLLILLPSLVWAWGAPQPPPHAIDLSFKKMPNDKSPKVIEPKEDAAKKKPQPEDDLYRYDAPPPDPKEELK